MNDEIHGAVRKQSEVSRQVEEKLGYVSRLSANTATFAEQTFSANREITLLAGKLREVVAHFIV